MYLSTAIFCAELLEYIPAPGPSIFDGIQFVGDVLVRYGTLIQSL